MKPFERGQIWTTNGYRYYVLESQGDGFSVAETSNEAIIDYHNNWTRECISPDAALISHYSSKEVLLLEALRSVKYQMQQYQSMRERVIAVSNESDQHYLRGIQQMADEVIGWAAISLDPALLGSLRNVLRYMGATVPEDQPAVVEDPAIVNNVDSYINNITYHAASGGTRATWQWVTNSEPALWLDEA